MELGKEFRRMVAELQHDPPPLTPDEDIPEEELFFEDLPEDVLAPSSRCLNLVNNFLVPPRQQYSATKSLSSHQPSGTLAQRGPLGGGGGTPPRAEGDSR